MKFSNLICQFFKKARGDAFSNSEAGGNANPQARKVIPGLTGLRGVAALLILIGHSVDVAPVLKTLTTAPLMNVLTFCGMSVSS